jgi:hypothetical protein
MNIFHVVEASQPFVITRCLLTDVGSPLQFPVRQASSSTDKGHWGKFNFSGYPSIVAMESPYRIHWIDLPSADFPNASVGAIIQPPSTLDTLADARPVACSIYAGWGTTFVNLTSTSEYIQTALAPFGSSINDFLWSIDWVSISSAWAAYLTPSLSDLHGTVDAAIYSTLGENLYTKNENSSHPAYIHEAVLGSLIANGMARNCFSCGIVHNAEDSQSGLSITLSDKSIKQWLTGQNRNPLNIDANDPLAGYSITVDSTITGVVYTTDHAPVKLAIAVLVLYCLFAAAHLLYMIKAVSVRTAGILSPSLRLWRLLQTLWKAFGIQPQGLRPPVSFGSRSKYWRLKGIWKWFLRAIYETRMHLSGSR